VVGLVLLDSKGEPLYANDEATLILGYPEHPTHLNAQKLRSEVLLAEDGGFRVAETYASGQRLFSCEILPLCSPPHFDERAAWVLIFEPVSRRKDKLRQLMDRYRLSPRERQVVALLANGLTSKEIAERMNVSPHTVKAFLRVIMVKLSVTTRSGIIGKIYGLM
jgi:DNA-binding CsgD family transcriptional regulator